MKRLIILLTMAFAFSFAMAQNTAYVDQYGTNIADVEQIGTDNFADVDQGALGSSVSNNKVPGNNGDWRDGAFITQIGDDNRATIDVDGSSNGSDIYQFGSGNEGIQDINTSGTHGTSWDLMGVDLDQLGNDNYALQTTVKSFGSSPIKRMYVIQNGDGNVVNQLSIGGYANSQHIVQVGNNNNNPVESGNTLDVSATGLANPLDLPWTFTNQGGYSSTNDYTQYSNQMKGVAHIYVDGDGNNTFQYQETSWSDKGNTATIDIAGNNSDVVQGQKGDYNSSILDLDGDGNIVTSSQYGDHNQVEVDKL